MNVQQVRMNRDIPRLAAVVRRLILLALTSFVAMTSLARGEGITEIAATCAVCHGDNGISTNELWPNLAGQQAGYLAEQITAYREKTRDVPSMWAAVKDLSDEEVKAIASYYSAMPRPRPSGEKINVAGLNTRAYCVSCHGLSGNTVISEWPNLAGQNKGYLVQQLAAYKSGERIHGLMNVIANELTDQQISDVAEYYSQIGSE